jgi:hypothetical protein
MPNGHTAPAAAETHAAQTSRAPRPEGAPQLYNTTEAAAYCRCAASSFHQMRLTVNGPKYVKLGKRVFYTKAALDLWLEEHTFQSTSEYTAA